MWKCIGHDLRMVEGDFGLELPIIITGATFAEGDEIRLTIKTAANGAMILEKTFGSIVDNTVKMELTEAESALLGVGSYVYNLDWYEDGVFLCNIIPCASFRVVDKA